MRVSVCWCFTVCRIQLSNFVCGFVVVGRVGFCCGFARLNLLFLILSLFFTTHLEDLLVNVVVRGDVALTRVGVAVQVCLVDFHFEEVLQLRVRLLSLLHHRLLTHLMQSHARVHFLDRFLQSFEAENQDGYIVERSANCRFTEAHFYAFSRCNVLIVEKGTLTARFCLALVVTARWGNCIRLPRGHLFVNTVPHTVNYLFVIETLKNTVTSNKKEVVVVLQLET